LHSTKFTKYHGAGNDFIIIEDYSCHFLPLLQKKISTLCHRNLGIGADGLILLQPSSIADVKMLIFNSDGSEADFCGNGLRCVIHYLNQLNSKSSLLKVETLAGVCAGKTSNTLIKASLPKAKILKKEIALKTNHIGYLVDTGVIHLVIFIPNIEDANLMKQAKDYRLKYNANVNFAKIEKSLIKIRTFEKGVENETFACGSGGGAVSLIASKLFNSKNLIPISFRSEEIANYEIDRPIKIWMEGPAKVIFEGKYNF